MGNCVKYIEQINLCEEYNFSKIKDKKNCLKIKIINEDIENSLTLNSKNNKTISNFSSSLKKGSFLFDNSKKIFLIDENKINNFSINFKTIFYYFKVGNNFKVKLIKNILLKDENSYIWRNLSINNNEGIKWKKGHCIKIGETIFYVKDSFQKIKFFNDYSKNFFQQKNIERIEFNKKIINSEDNCRFCYLNNNFDTNPLISICLCVGSLKYIHIDCLKQWVNVDQNLNNGNYFCFDYKKLVCKVCMQEFSSKIFYKNKYIDLIYNFNNQNNFLLLESYEKNLNSSLYEPQSKYYLNFDNKQEFIFGRNILCDINISDLSVSRQHLKIKFSKGEFILYDLNSKFGTLLGPYKSLKIKNKEKIKINHLSLEISY